jgi:hypothetical protein
MRRDRILYHAFKKFAASRPKAMKKPLSPVIASAAKQSPADMEIASPPAAARNVTVENFLPQQGWGG